MKKSIHQIILIVFVIGVNCLFSYGQSWQALTQEGLPYQLFKPANYNSGSYPLIINLHGAGLRGTGNTANTDEGAVFFSSSSAQASHPAYIIAPQCPPDQMWVDLDWADTIHVLPPMNDNMRRVIAIIDDVISKYNIDLNRVYVSGGSMGGYGTYELVYRRPYMFAAASVYAGGYDVTKLTAISHVPFRIYHGDADGIVPVSNSRRVVAALENAGGDPLYYELAGAGHIWACPANDEVAMQNWMFSKNQADNTKPNPNPASFSVNPYPLGSGAISMTATKATDASGVEYYFEETSGNAGGDNSGWQWNPVYVDGGLNPQLTYSYKVKYRDRSRFQNETDFSTVNSATTSAAPVAGNLAYEGFNYSTGNASDLAGGKGMIDSWSGVGGLIASPGLTYSSVSSEGNTLKVLNNLPMERQFSESLGFSNTLWMGFITMEGGNSSTHNISFYNGLNKVMVLSKSGYDNWDISIDGTGDPDNLPWQGQKNVIHFWVFKMEKGNNTKITVWRDISSEPTSGGTEITLPSFSFEKISVASDQLLFDELRIGTNFASIISSSSGTMINVTSVSVASSSASIAVGETKLLTPTVLPLNATNNSVTWQSNNSSVVTVSSDGLLTGISSGTATITVTTQDGGFAATCSVTVTENSTNLGFAKKDIVGALISPIPSKDLLNIRLVSFEKALTVQLYSSTGIELIKELHKNVNSLTLNVSRFPNGVYFIKMTNGAEMITRKVTISR